MQNDSVLAVFTNIFASPTEAFGAIKERPRVLLPLLLLLLGSCAVSLLFTTRVDLAWYVDAQIQASNPALTEAQRNTAVAAALKIPAVAYGFIGGGASIIFITLLLALSALYYTAVSFFTADGIRYKQWFALGCWCVLPALLSILAQIVNVLISDVTFMPQDAINPLSFGNVFGIKSAGASFVQRILLQIDVTTLWSVTLAILGYQAFTKSSIGKSAVIVLGPFAVIILVGTAITFARH